MNSYQSLCYYVFTTLFEKMRRFQTKPSRIWGVKTHQKKRMDRYLGYLASCSSTRGFAELEFRQNQLRSEPDEYSDAFNVYLQPPECFQSTPVHPQTSPEHISNDPGSHISHRRTGKIKNDSKSVLRALGPEIAGTG